MESYCSSRSQSAQLRQAYQLSLDFICSPNDGPSGSASTSTATASTSTAALERPKHARPAIEQGPDKPRKKHRTSGLAVPASASDETPLVPRIPSSSDLETHLEPCSDDCLPSKEYLKSLRLAPSSIFSSSTSGTLLVAPPCQQCRQEKRRCDRAWPICGRCSRLSNPAGSCERVQDAVYEGIDQLKPKKSRKSKQDGKIAAESEGSPAQATEGKVRKSKSLKTEQPVEQSSAATKAQDSPVTSTSAAPPRFRSSGRQDETELLSKIEALGKVVQSGLTSASNDLSIVRIAERDALTSKTELTNGDHESTMKAIAPMDRSRPCRASPPLWATSTEELIAAAQLCPAPHANPRIVSIKLSRSLVARGVLLQKSEGSISCQGQLTISMPTRLRAQAATARDEKAPASSSSSSAPVQVSEPPPLPPFRRSFMSQMMRRSSTPLALDGAHVKTEEPEATPQQPQPCKKDEFDSGSPSAESLPSKVTPENRKSSQAADLAVLGLLSAFERGDKICVFLAGRCHCRDSTRPCFGVGCGSLGLLPSSLPEQVGAVEVGSATVTKYDPASRPGLALFKIQFDEAETAWWHPIKNSATPWMIPTRLSDVDAPSLYPQSILQGMPCSHCRAAVIRRHWAGWTCQQCGTMISASRINLSREVERGKLPIITDGPKMDNGRAIFSSAISRELRVWNDGIKVAKYMLPPDPTTTALRDASTGLAGPSNQPAIIPGARLYHLLFNRKRKELADEYLEFLTETNVPYERTTQNLDRPDNLPVFFSLCLSLKPVQAARPHVASPALRNQEQDSKAIDDLLDVAEDVEELISRLADEEKLEQFDTLTGIVGQYKRVLNLSHRSDGHAVNRPLAYLHLGSPATLIIQQQEQRSALSDGKAVNRGPAVVLNAMVSHGDDLLLCRSHESSSCKVSRDYGQDVAKITLLTNVSLSQVIVESKNFGVGIVLS